MGHKAPVSIEVDGDKVLEIANPSGAVRAYDALIVKGEKLVGMARLMGKRVVSVVSIAHGPSVRRNNAGEWLEISQVGRKAVKSKLEVERVLSFS